MVKWNFEAEYLQSCNCSYGCPCTFNALPTKGNCEALVAWHVRKGQYGKTRLDGATFAWGLWWPGAIHHGNGASRLYLDSKTDPAQQEAIETIVSGKAGGGVFAIFPTTISRAYPTERTKIDFRFQGYESSLQVDGIGEVVSEHIRNPVTGAAFEAQVVLPGGMNFKKAEVTRIRRWRLRDELVGWNMAHEDVSGFVAIQKYTEKGPEKRPA